MKQTKTRRALLIVTLMMLVLTLGFGLLFMQREKASADESASELIPLADAELQATGAYMAGSEGVWWDSPTTGTQVRLLFWKVSSGDPVRLSAGASNHYNADPNIELTIDDGTLQTKTLADWNLKDTHSAWVDNMAAHNGDTSVGEIWVCSNHEFLTKIKEVHVKPGFAQRDASGAETNVKATKDYYLWNADTKGWQTRITSFTATYDGTLEQDGALNPAKLNITAQFKDGTSGTVDGTLITVGELDTSDLGTKQVTLTYQDKTFDLSVTVEEKRTLTSISVEDISARRWTYITNDDLVVKAHYGAEDEEGEQLSPVDFTITEAPDMWTTGETATGKVSYTHNEVTKDATFTVNVQDNTTTDKYLDVVPGKSFNGTNGGGQDGTGFMFGDRALLSVPIKIVGFDLGYALGSRNSIGFELIKGMHFVDYIDFVYDGSPKTLQELLTDGTIKSAGTSDNGVLVFWFVDAANRAKVSQIHCKAGMQWPKQVGDHWSALEEGQNAVTAASELLSDLVLKHDVYLENNGASWRPLRIRYRRGAANYQRRASLRRRRVGGASRCPQR